MGDMLRVLDHGYVRIIDTFGDDLMVVNSARVSYDKQSDELTDKDVRLIKFLARERHMSPFRAPRAMFEVYAPLFIARQWWRYAVDSSHLEDGTPWNESSRRYITEEPTFYVPKADQWRSAPANSKQGSGDVVNWELGHEATMRLFDMVDRGMESYEWALENGICAEQARLFLPAYGMYVRWRWTASLQSIAHFLNQRLEQDAQKEIQEYAQAVYTLIKPKFPVSIGELVRIS